jgi:type VI secretion system protein ImpB
MSSIHSKQGRVRPPRVHISYEVEVGDATKKVELPFVMGVMGDFSGKPAQPLKALADRKIVEINRDNIDNVLKSMTPALAFDVDNLIDNDGTQMPVSLKFESLADFDPARVAEQIEPLKKLLAIRTKLKELITKADKSPELATTLEKALKNSGDIEELAKELGVSGE